MKIDIPTEIKNIKSRKRNIKFREMEKLLTNLGFIKRQSRKGSSHYLKLDYPITLKRLDDGKYCAEISIIRGCKGYGDSIPEALEELDGIKETLIELSIEQGKAIPEPTIQLEIPKSQFQRLTNKKKLLNYAK